MSTLAPIVRTVDTLRDIVSGWKSKGLKVGLVPTMGALHHGHLSLVDEIAEECDKVIVSIFVNPTQFGAHEDLGDYPRQEAEDRKKLSEGKTALIFAPSADEMYPNGFETVVSVPKLARNFEGVNRPGHFEGVATVVSKLIIQSMCDTAIFGEKDYQQLAVIKRFTKDLNLPCHIMGGTLVRETDGLAASSRNVYLTPEERKIAGTFNGILKSLVVEAEVGQELRAIEAKATEALLEAGFSKVDYVSVVDADNLEIIDNIKKEARVLSVARIRHVRLLDNMAIRPPNA